MDFNPFPRLEAALYRRSDEQSSSPLECHNHILQGSYLRYIKRSLRPKDIGRYRLDLVQGTLRGRLQSIRLHSGSTVAAVTTAGTPNDLFKYEIHVSGTDDCKIRTILGSQEVKWLISFPSEEVQQRWLVALENACDFAGNWPKKDEIDRLKDLARKMRSNVDARMRFHRFKLISRCFVGRRAIRWIVKYEGCTPSQATIIGQKMLSLGLFQHITNEHVFCNKKLLYQFPNNFDHVQTPKNSGGHPLLTSLASRSSSNSILGDVAAEGMKDDRLLMRKMSMNSEELVQALHVSNQSLSSAQTSLSEIQANFTVLENLIDNSLHTQRKSVINQLKDDYFTAIFQSVVLIYMLSSQYIEWYLLTRTAIVAAIVLAITWSVLLKRGFGALLQSKKKIKRNLSGDSESYKSTLQKMSAALQAGSSTSQINLDVDAYEPLFDAVYESGESDLDDVDDLDSEDGSDEDYDEDEKDAEDDNDDNDDNDDDDADDDECDDDDCDDDELMEYDKQEGAGDLPLIPGEDDYKRLDSHRGIPSDGKPLIRSAEKSIMKPCMWPNYPLLLKRSKSMLPANTAPQEIKRLSAPLHIHQSGEPEVSEFAVESDLFIGKAFVIIADLHDSPPYFNRKERKFEAVFQGRFKKPISFAHVYTGQAYDTPINHIPAKWLVNTGLQFMGKLQPAHQACLQGNRPHILSPLVSTAQKIIVSKPGQEPSISYGIDTLEENMNLLDPIFSKMSHRKRKAYFVKRENLNSYTFNPDLVYTFDLYQHRLNLSTFKIDLGFVKYDLRKMLGCRPIQIMAVEWVPPLGDHQSGGKMSPKADRDRNGKDTSLDITAEDVDWKFIYNIEIWHKRSVPRGQKKVSIAFPESSGVKSEVKNDVPHAIVKNGAGAIADAFSTPQPASKLRIEISETESTNSSPYRTPRLTPRPSSAPSCRPTVVAKDDTTVAHRAFNMVTKLRSGSGDANAGAGSAGGGGGASSGGGGLVHWRSSSCIPHTPDKSLSSTPVASSLPPSDSGRIPVPIVPARKFQLPMFRSQVSSTHSPKSSEL